MSVVIGTPDVNSFVKASFFQLIAMIGNVCCEVGVKTVCSAQNIIFQFQFFNGFLGFSLFPISLSKDLRGLQPQCSVLFVRISLFRQRGNGFRNIAGLMQVRFHKPFIVMNTVTFQIGLHFRYIPLQSELCHGITGFPVILVQIFISVGFPEFLCKLPDIIPLISVFRKLDGILSADQLDVPGLNGSGKFLDLVSGIIDIELPPHIVAGLLHDRCQSISQHTTAGVAHMHGAGGIGGYKFHHQFLSMSYIHIAVGLSLTVDLLQHITVPLLRQTEIDESGTGNIHPGKPGPFQRQMRHQCLRDLSGRHPECFCSGHGMVGGKISVGVILGDLHGTMKFSLGQLSRLDRRSSGIRQKHRDFFFCLFNQIHSLFSRFRTLI